MTIIVAKTCDNASHIRDEFRRYDRMAHRLLTHNLS